MSTFLRLTVSAALIAIFVTQVGVEELLTQLMSCDPLLFLIACLLFLSGQAMNALRWRWLLAISVSRPPSLGHLMALVMVGMFFNFFLPSTVGGDVVKAELVRGSVGGRTQAYLSLLVGRILAFIAVLVIGLVAMASAFLLFGWGDLEVVLAAMLFAFVLGGLWLAYRSKVLRDWWLRIVPARVAEISRGVLQAVDVYNAQPAVLNRVFLLAIAANLIGQVLAVWALAEGLGIDVPFYYHVIAVPLVVLVTLIPVSFNGIGLREAAFVYFYGKVAVSTAAAVSLSLAFTAVLVVLSLLGGLCLLSPSVSRMRGSSESGEHVT